MIVNGLKFNCLARWSLMQSLDQTKESWADIQKAMEGNTSVTDVYLGPYFYSSITSADLAAFLQRCAAYLTNLRLLSIGTLEFTKTPIEGASGLSLFLPTAQQLCTLRIERHLLLQSPDDVQRLADGFRNHPSLQRISLPSIHPSWLLLEQEDLREETRPDTLWGATAMTMTTTRRNCANLGNTTTRTTKMMKALDPLLYSLATIVHLESLQLGLSDTSYECLRSLDRMDRVSSPEALSQLGSLPRLSWLVISRFHVQDAHVQALCQTLQPQEQQPLPNVDGHNTNHSNHHRQQQQVFFANRVVAPIKILDFTKNRQLTVVAWQAILDMLQTHVHLESLDMLCLSQDHAAHELKEQVNIFLKLNREGRRRKLRELEADKQAWINTVARFFVNDLTSLTVLVRESPWICLPNGTVSPRTMSSSSPSLPLQPLVALEQQPS
ncbi:hypothetical protein ACA910_002269 [Epithemia clementina (nom. ined.)]